MTNNPNNINYAKVQSDNWVNNGGNGDVNPDVMADLGFTPWTELLDTVNTGINIPESERPQNMKIAQAAGKIVCGDCGQVFPCPHGTGSKTIGN